MILVTGATGNIGTELVKHLRTDGARMRVITRDEKKVAHLDASVERVIGDRHDPSIIRQALQGVDKVFLLPVLLDNHEADRLLIEAAKQAGVQLIVQISSGAVRMETKGGIGGLHREIEQLIEDSGIAWTFLRPGGFMSNTLQWVATIKSQSKVFNPTGEGKTAPISPYDIAAVAAVALISSGHEGKAYDLTGPELLSAHEQVEILSKVIGKSIECVDIPIEVAVKSAIANGLPEILVESLAEIWKRIRAGGGTFQTSEVERLTGRPAQTFETWCHEYRSAFL
jgi:(4-alkanoyl-5-oxo-2,5-dihydrofuran-3-yl)methyl phosphate reductase